MFMTMMRNQSKSIMIKVMIGLIGCKFNQGKARGKNSLCEW